MTVHVGSVPGTSELFTVTLDSKHGAEYDTVLYSLDLNAGSTVNILKTDFNLPLDVGDALVVIYPNVSAVTIGAQLILE
jgi:hypothetical protein